MHKKPVLNDSSDKKNIKSAIKIILPILIFAVIIIFLYAMSSMSGEESGDVSRIFSDMIWNSIEESYYYYRNSEVWIFQVDLALSVRKFAHVIIFFFICIVLFFCYRIIVVKKRSAILLSYASTLFIAICDELLQTLSPGRTATIGDVIIDMLGANFAVLLIVLTVLINKLILYISPYWKVNRPK